MWDLILGRPNLSNCLNLGVHTQAKRSLALAGECGKATPFKQCPCQSRHKLQEPFGNLSLCSSAEENTLLASFWRGAISRLFSTAGRNEINCLRMISKGWQNSLLLWQQTWLRKKGRALLQVWGEDKSAELSDISKLSVDLGCCKGLVRFEPVQVGSRAFLCFGQLSKASPALRVRAASPSTLLLSIDLSICAPHSPSHCPSAFHVVRSGRMLTPRRSQERAAVGEQNCEMSQSLNPTIPHPCCMSQHGHYCTWPTTFLWGKGTPSVGEETPKGICDSITVSWSGDISLAALSLLVVVLVLAPGFSLMTLALLAVLLYIFQFPVTDLIGYLCTKFTEHSIESICHANSIRPF